MPPSDILRRSRSLAKVDCKTLSRSYDPSDYESDEGDAILQAIRQFSTDKPLPRVQVIQSNTVTLSNFQYSLSALDPLWNEDYKVTRIQYPLDREGLGRSLEHDSISEFDWEISQNPLDESWILKFTDGWQPGYGGFAVYYTQPHKFDPILNTSSLTLKDEDICVQLCAARLLQFALSETSKWSDSNEANINTGGVKQGIENYMNLCMNEYTKMLRKSVRTMGPVYASVSTEDRWGGRLFHKKERNV